MIDIYNAQQAPGNDEPFRPKPKQKPRPFYPGIAGPAFRPPQPQLRQENYFGTPGVPGATGLEGRAKPIRKGTELVVAAPQPGPGFSRDTLPGTTMGNTATTSTPPPSGSSTTTSADSWYDPAGVTDSSTTNIYAPSGQWGYNQGYNRFVGQVPEDYRANPNEILKRINGKLYMWARTKPWGIDYSAITAATKDENSPFYGINPEGLPEWYAQKMSNLITGKANVKDKLMVQAMADVIRARQASPLYSENDTRNSMLDIYNTQGAAWEGQQRNLEESGADRGIVDSGVFARGVGEARAANNASTQQQMLGVVGENAKANYEYGRNRLESAIQDLMQLVQQKRGNRRLREQWLNQAMQLKAQASAQNAANIWGTVGSLAGGLGGALGGMGGGK